MACVTSLPIVVVSRVRDLAEGAIRLEQGVFTLHYISVAAFVLGLVVAGMGVSHGVRVVVLGVRLRKIIYMNESKTVLQQCPSWH
jgi:hypothetical protein